eukprot:6491710-Amphidinium_carterae.2
MSFAVTYLAILAALYFIVGLLRWAASMRIQATEVAGDIDGEVKTEAVVPVPMLEVVFFSVHGLMWLSAVFRDLLNIIWRLFRGLFLAAAVSLPCAQLLGLLYVGARTVSSSSMLRLFIARAIAVDFAYFSPACFSTALSGHNAVRIISMVLHCLCLVCIHGGLTCTGMAFAWDDFSVTMSFAVTYSAILAALYFIVELLRWAASMRIQGAEVAGDSKGEVKTEAVVPVPVLEAVFFSVHGSMWLNAVFRDLLNTVAEWAEDSAYWSAFLATAMWGAFAVLASATLAFCKALGLAVKFALESVNLLILGTDFVVESAKFNMCQGHVEVRKLLTMNMEGEGYLTPCLLWIDKAIDSPVHGSHMDFVPLIVYLLGPCRLVCHPGNCAVAN